jgi:large subunit ribosomal protein L13
MKTILPKPSDIQRKWYLVDADGKTLGHISTRIADILRGKTKPDFTPHMDTGDGVVVINAEKIQMTGGKWAQKKYYTHSGYLGGLREISAQELLQKKPTELITKAVSGMIPNNRLKKGILSRLRVYAGAEQDLSAQKPEAITL